MTSCNMPLGPGQGLEWVVRSAWVSVMSWAFTASDVSALGDDDEIFPLSIARVGAVVYRSVSVVPRTPYEMADSQCTVSLT